MPVFDADVHIHERPADLAPFCEMPWRLALEQDKGDERFLDTPGYSPLTPLDPILTEPDQDPYMVRAPEDLRRDLAARGVDAALLITDRFVGLAQAQDDDYPVKIAAAYNRYLRERWLDPAKGLYGAVLLAGQAPEQAAEELRANAGGPGVAAGLLSTVHLYPLYGSRQYDPIYAAAEETGLPLVLHGATSYGSVFPWQLQSYESPLARGALAQPLAAIANLTSMVTTGVFARFPGVRVLFCEAGLSWLPFVAERLDGQYHHLREHAPELDLLPSEYIRRQVYVTTHPLGGDLAGLLRAIGADRVVYGSDWPHFDHDEPARLNGIGARARRRVLGQNAAELFGLR